MYSIVAHHYWGRPGGGELVASSAAIALDRAGLSPILVSLSRFNQRDYIDWYGIDITSYPQVALNLKLNMFALYMRLFIWYPIIKAINRYSDVRIVFIDSPTYKPMVKLVRERDISILEYIHFPFDATFKREYRYVGFYYKDDPYMKERYSRFPLNIYINTYSKIYSLFARDNPFNYATYVLTNSRWTAEIIKSIYGNEPIVLNPPIPPNIAVVGSPRSFGDRLPLVVMLGRFSEEKRYHWVVTELMSRLVRGFPSTKLVIFGGATTRTQLGYVNRVAGLARNAGFGVKVINEGNVINELDEEHQVYLRLNAPRAEINETMDRARAFLHATINEHWGIAVAEAMARGLPVVVHRSGGAWSDLAMNGEVGLGYEGVDEAVEALAKLLTDEKAWGHYSGKSLGRVGEITFDKFVSRLSELVKRLA